MKISLLFATMMLSAFPLAHATQVFQCESKGSVIFQSKPCPHNIKTHEQLLNVTRDDLKSRKEAAEKAEAEYQERLKQSAAQRGDLVIAPKHNHVDIDKLKASSKPMAFKECKKFSKDAELSSSRASVISDTKSEYLVRLCNKDGSIILACTASEQKLVITESAHCTVK